MSKIRLQSLLAVAVLAAMAVLPRRGEAQVIHDNGVPDQQVGRTVSPPFAVADNFTLSSAATLGSFQWYVLRSGTGGPATTTGSYQWNIFSDLGGAPGSVLFSGAVVNQSATKTGYTCCTTGYEIYLFDTPIGSVPLSAGTYWLGIGSYSSLDGVGYWATASQQGDAVQSSDDGVTYNPIDEEMAFSVSGIARTTTPEPASVVLLATGLIGVLGVARRRSVGRV